MRVCFFFLRFSTVKVVVGKSVVGAGAVVAASSDPFAAPVVDL